MTLAKFEIFRTVVEAGSLTKATETLNLTQSGVSHAIASLESEMGFHLLKRDRSGISLTDNGERILKYIREILHWDELFRVFLWNSQYGVVPHRITPYSPTCQYNRNMTHNGNTRKVLGHRVQDRIWS